MLDAVNGFGRSDMRQRRCRDDVAYGVDALDRGAEVLVDLDLVALDGDAQLFESDVFDVGLDADGRQHYVGRKRLGALLALDLDRAAAVVADRYLLYGGRSQYLGSEFAESALHGCRRVLVLQWHDLRHVLDYGYLDAQRREDIGELAADSARAHDDDRFGQLGQCQRLARRNHVTAVDWHERHFARACSRGEDDGSGFV